MEYLKDESFEWEGAELIGEFLSPAGSSTTSNATLNNATLDLENKANWNDEELAAYQALRSKRKKCIVAGCTSRSIPIAKSYHQLPVRNLIVWQKWVEAIRWSKNDPEWLPSTDQPLICSRHFEDTDFITYQGATRSRLNHDAIPALYLDPPEGTVMDPKFNEPREPPRFVAFTIYKAAHQKNQKSVQNVSNLVQSSNNYHSFDIRIKQPKELLEVTPEFNFEGSSEYDQDEEFYKNHPAVEEMMETVEDDLNDDGYLPYENHSSSTLLYGETEITEQELQEEICDEDLSNNGEDELSYVQPPNTSSNKKAYKFLRNPASNFRSSSSNQQYRQHHRQHVQQQSIVSRNRLFSASRITNKNCEENSAGRQNCHYSSNSMPPRKILMKFPTESISQGVTAPTGKHKIGMSKCRVIVETIEREMEDYLKAVKTRVAQEMNIPYQVVHGVWQMKDDIKQRMK